MSGSWFAAQLRNLVSTFAPSDARDHSDNRDDNVPHVVFCTTDKLAWPDEGERPVRISVALAERCGVGIGLLDLANDEDGLNSTRLSAADTGSPSASLLQSSSSQATLAVPCVPGSVPSLGISILDKWAIHTADAAAKGLSDASWLPAFLVHEISTHPGGITAAACAADFLGCRPFLDLALAVQLLRIAVMLDGNSLRRWLSGGWWPKVAGQPRRVVVPPLSQLSEDDFRKLPRMHVSPHAAPNSTEKPPQVGCTSSLEGGPAGPSAAPQPPAQQSVQQQQQEQQPELQGGRQAGPREPEETGRGEPWDEDAPAAPVTDPDMASAAAAEAVADDPAGEYSGSDRLSGPESVEAEWYESFEPPQQPLESSGARPPPRQQQLLHPDGGDGAAGCVALPLRMLPLGQMEALVKAVLRSDLLRHVGAHPQEVGAWLYRLGFKPSWETAASDEVCVTNRKQPYLRLPLEYTLTDRPGKVLRYELDEVFVEVEAHDQGWSDFHADHATYNNSWTWGELLVTTGGAQDQRLRPGDPGRLYTNLHAVSRWQTHRVTLGPDSQVVKDVNAWAARARGAAAGSSAEGSAEGSDGGAAGASAATDGGQREQEHHAGCELVLRVCAAFPGWRHSVRRAAIVAYVRPVEPASAGGEA